MEHQNSGKYLVSVLDSYWEKDSLKKRGYKFHSPEKSWFKEFLDIEILLKEVDNFDKENHFFDIISPRRTYSWDHGMTDFSEQEKNRFRNCEKIWVNG